VVIIGLIFMLRTETEILDVINLGMSLNQVHAGIDGILIPYNASFGTKILPSKS
ncbi:hypothetical protein PIB30_078832, partial [Stylosanthes scabra]|nr:hypothetical protein [Stylosanthes scabra]